MDRQDRLNHLESLLSHQESALADLSDVVAKQWRLLDEMDHRFKRLEARLQNLEDRADQSPQKEPPPPHY
ncbi:MAG: SlyX family protein [Pseudomonadota bacterium]